MIRIKNDIKAKKSKDDNVTNDVIKNDELKVHGPDAVRAQLGDRQEESQGGFDYDYVQAADEVEPQGEKLLNNSTNKIKPLLDFWEAFKAEGSPKSGGTIKGILKISSERGFKSKVNKLTQTRGNRVNKTKLKVKSTPVKTPLKGKLIQMKLNLKPIRSNQIQVELHKTSTDELKADDKGGETVDHKLDG